jgi:hypothetical protein
MFVLALGKGDKNAITWPFYWLVNSAHLGACLILYRLVCHLRVDIDNFVDNFGLIVGWSGGHKGGYQG